MGDKDPISHGETDMALVIVHVQKDSATWAIVVNDRQEAVDSIMELIEKNERLRMLETGIIMSLLDGLATVTVYDYTFNLIEVNTPLDVSSFPTL
jgi:hypothetical protein